MIQHEVYHRVAQIIELDERHEAFAFAFDLLKSVLDEALRQHLAGRLFHTTQILHDVLQAGGYLGLAVRVLERAEEIRALRPRRSSPHCFHEYLSHPRC